MQYVHGIHGMKQVLQHIASFYLLLFAIVSLRKSNKSQTHSNPKGPRVSLALGSASDPGTILQQDQKDGTQPTNAVVDQVCEVPRGVGGGALAKDGTGNRFGALQAVCIIYINIHDQSNMSKL